MTAPHGPHLDARDLANLAGEKLGRKKTERLLAHCKECPPCADMLLDAVSDQPRPDHDLRLSKWNWISIGILIVALAAVVLAMVWFLRAAAPPETSLPGAGIPGDSYETVYTEVPGTHFEDVFTHAVVSADARRMLWVDGLGVRLLELPGGSERESELMLAFDGVMGATYDGNGRLARFANQRRDLGWFLEDGDELRLISIPPAALPAFAPGNRDVVWTRAPGTHLFFGYPPADRAYQVDGRVSGLAWAAIGDFAYALVMDRSGSSSLLRGGADLDEPEVVRDELDASALPNGVAVSPSGEVVFLALASDGPPDAVARHSPDEGRDLDIYELSLASGNVRRIVDSEGDDFWPWVAGEYLYWTHNDYSASVVAFPLEEGSVREPLALSGAALGEPDAQQPSWSPDGRRVAFTTGRRRIADWGLNLDVAVREFASFGESTGDPSPIGQGETGGRPPNDGVQSLVAGYHEDQTPEWSPNGTWLAYRSRRSSSPVPYYAGPGVADDIFLRRADDPEAEEMRLTDFGWEVGQPDWSPEGRRLIFDSWERGGVPRVSRLWLASIDPRTGSLDATERLELPETVSGSVSARWSPVGDELLIIERKDPGAQALWRYALDTRAVHKVADFESHTLSGADWTPDGAFIVFSAEVEGTLQLFVVSREGGDPRRLTDEPTHVLHPRVSPDGRWVVATRLAHRKEVRRLPVSAIR